jgi:hypothetical protein
MQVFVHPVIPSLDVTRSMVALYNVIYRQVVADMLPGERERGTICTYNMYICTFIDC